MTSYYEPPKQETQPTQPLQSSAPSHERPARWWSGRPAVAIYGVLGGLIIGAAGASGDTDTNGSTPTPSATVTIDPTQAQRDQLEERELAVRALEEELAALEVALDEREKAITAAEEEAAARQIPGDGVYLVGTDIEPGTYRSTAAVSSDCYWGIYAGGTNGGDIIANGLPGGGRPTVELEDGQEFETQRCGTWERQ